MGEVWPLSAREEEGIRRNRTWWGERGRAVVVVVSFLSVRQGRMGEGSLVPGVGQHVLFLGPPGSYAVLLVKGLVVEERPKGGLVDHVTERIEVDEEVIQVLLVDVVGDKFPLGPEEQPGEHGGGLGDGLEVSVTGQEEFVLFGIGSAGN